MMTAQAKDKWIDHVKEKRDEEIYKRHKEGQTYRSIGKSLGISATAAFNAVCRIDYKKLIK